MQYDQSWMGYGMVGGLQAGAISAGAGFLLFLLLYWLRRHHGWSDVRQMSCAFGLALLLTAIGLYGVTAYNVARRRNEIGIRMAIGANRLQIALYFLRGAFAQVLLGLLLGLPIAVLVATLLSARLYKVGTIDPVSLGLPAAALLLSAVVASALPARRAASVEPLEALRTD